MKKAIVSGANGFVGAAVCQELLSQGVSVTAIVRATGENKRNNLNDERIKIVYCELSDYNSLIDRIDDRDFDVFYHFAWIGSAGELRCDEDIQLSNVRYTCDAVRSCAKLKCKKFVFASSIMEYEITAIMETDRTPGLSTLYSTAKITADYMARTIAGDLGVEYIRTIISNIYGPGENSPRLINTSLRKLLNGEQCDFSPGEQMYDFIYISDAAGAFFAVGEKGKPNKTYYIGSLNPRKLKDYIIEMKNCIGEQARVNIGALAFNGVSLTYEEFDIQAIKRDTGFVPKVSFDEGIKNTIEWLRGKDK